MMLGYFLGLEEYTFDSTFEHDNGCWYSFFGTGLSVSRQDAQQLCQQQNAQLPIITTLNEAFGLRSQLGK